MESSQPRLGEVHILGRLGEDALGSIQGALNNKAAHTYSFFRCRLLDAGLFLFTKQNQHSPVVFRFWADGLVRRQETSSAWASSFSPPALACRVDYRTICPVVNGLRMHPENHDIGL